MTRDVGARPLLSELRIAFKAYREHARNERLTRAQLETPQIEKFRRLVNFANEHSPFYTELIARAHIDITTCTPGDFPVMTKGILMRNFDRLVTDHSINRQKIAQFLTRSDDPNEFLDGKYHVLHTSGTSGEVGYFIYSPEDWARGMAQSLGRRRRRQRLKRRRFGRIRVAFYGAVGGHFCRRVNGKQRKTRLRKVPDQLGIV